MQTHTVKNSTFASMQYPDKV